jgi:hypothetical protein
MNQLIGGSPAHQTKTPGQEAGHDGAGNREGPGKPLTGSIQANASAGVRRAFRFLRQPSSRRAKVNVLGHARLHS